MEHDSPEDIAKKRLASVDTSSSINLSFDKSFSPEALKLLSLSSVRLGTFVPNRSMGKRATMHRIQTFSSDSQLLPRIREILGSSDSQLKAPTNFSDIHHGPVAALEVEVDVEPAATETTTSFTDSLSSDGASMTTADMSLTDGGTAHNFVGQSSASMRAAALDQELQAAVDVMLQGSVPLAAPDGAYYNEGKMLGHTVTPPPRAMGASMPPTSSICSSESQRTGGGAPLLGPYYHAIQSTRQLRQKLAHRFSRHRGAHTTSTTDNSSDDHTTAQSSPGIGNSATQSPSLLPMSDREAKRKLGESVDETCEKRAKTSGGADPQQHFLGPAAPPAPWIPRFMYPVVYYVQLRPLKTLGIVLTVLVILLVLIIVILIVGVFPYLMRSTLQDFSMIVTSLHAIPPPEIAQALSLEDRSLSHTRLMAIHGGRVAKEFVVKPDMLSGLPGEHAGQPVPMVIAGFPTPVQRVQSLHVLPPQHQVLPLTSVMPRSSAIQVVPPMPRVFVPSSDAPKLASTLLSSTSSLQMWPSTASVSKAATTTIEDAFVTITAESVSTVHIQRQLAPPAATSTVVVAAAATPVMPPQVSVGDTKSLDTGSHASSMYMMQLAGNMTSGGPIGVSIEFTEPLRMLWRDTVVGIIHYPESIHVPGRGMTQWKWPPFEVSIPANGTGPSADDRMLVRKHDSVNSEQQAPESLIQLGADRIIDSGVGGIAQRRALGGSNSAVALGRSGANSDPSAALPNDLASWFTAIQTHKSFTMHWKSRVKLSAMGIHTSNIKFEKSVHVLCSEDKSCLITDIAFTF
ncbi:hypothetical protein GGH94_001381 [Coemansia aciculifera]|uniref:Uncharacterized protein n=1 Tax=Coemansia aciculifera TaxID=417176 RepID=A0A9W8M701_9FUNG|nr:hypothetical protein GGH94_001381 [Coemansia aciculifera]KAJ2874814.1 hypothetical protein GGH93_002121 [Coemansia aciculifera]